MRTTRNALTLYLAGELNVLQHPCPVYGCRAWPGHTCVNLSHVEPRLPIKRPHKERIDYAFQCLTELRNI